MAQEMVKLPRDKKYNDDWLKEQKFSSKDCHNFSSQSASNSNIFQNAFESSDAGKQQKKILENDKNSVIAGTKIANECKLVSHKESLLKNKQENDFTVRKINNSFDAPETVRNKRGHSEEHSPQDRVSPNRFDTEINKEDSCKTVANNVSVIQPLHKQTNSRIEDLNLNSLKRRKELKTASLGNLIENFEENSQKMVRKVFPVDRAHNNNNVNSRNDHQVINGFAKSVANVFQQSSTSEHKNNSSFAKKKLVSEYNNSTSSNLSSNISEIDIIRRYMGFDKVDTKLDNEKDAKHFNEYR